MNNPLWAIKYVHKSKISAVKIVTWEEHHEVATVPSVYTLNGEPSDGMKAAQMMVAAPEMLEALQELTEQAGNTFHNNPQLVEAILKARQAIERATL